MKRADFTLMLTTLLLRMIQDGEQPVLDYGLRSSDEQNRLYRLGFSKCDGIKKISRHQLGLAVDIYFEIDGKIVFDYDKNERAKELAKKYHDYWVSLGGEPIIDWDKGHFEVKP